MAQRFAVIALVKKPGLCGLAAVSSSLEFHLVGTFSGLSTELSRTKLLTDQDMPSLQTTLTEIQKYIPCILQSDSSFFSHAYATKNEIFANHSGRTDFFQFQPHRFKRCCTIFVRQYIENLLIALRWHDFLVLAFALQSPRAGHDKTSYFP